MKEPSEVQKETEDCIDNKQEDEINNQTDNTATEKSKCDESVSGGSPMLETDKQEDNTEGVYIICRLYMLDTGSYFKKFTWEMNV